MWKCRESLPRLVCRDPVQLVEHLRSMAEGNALIKRRQVLPRDTALAAAATYMELFKEEDGSIPATFQVFNFPFFLLTPFLHVLTFNCNLSSSVACVMGVAGPVAARAEVASAGNSGWHMGARA